MTGHGAWVVAIVLAGVVLFMHDVNRHDQLVGKDRESEFHPRGFYFTAGIVFSLVVFLAMMAISSRLEYPR